jgi:transposase InsO family protein
VQELELKSIRITAKKDYKKRQKNAKQNLLKQQFFTNRPKQVWVGDFTYFRINGNWLYFCMTLDLYSRKIVGYQVSHKPQHESCHGDIQKGI